MTKTTRTSLVLWLAAAIALAGAVTAHFTIGWFAPLVLCVAAVGFVVAAVVVTGRGRKTPRGSVAQR